MACGQVDDARWCALLAQRFAMANGMQRICALRVGLAVSELVSNVARHGGGHGVVILRALTWRAGVEIIVSDDGPGIASPNMAIQDGWSRGSLRTLDSPRDGLGAGLGAVIRAMDEVHIASPPEGGTIITARKYIDVPVVKPYDAA
jgi:serine/threonine-protein kinase RsbT